MQAERSYWSGYFQEIARPIDHAVRRVPPIEAVAFVKGCERISQHINFLNPDILFIPLRGAAPIDWALQRFYELKGGRNPNRVYLPIGTSNDPVDGIEWGPEKLVKRKIVERSINSLRGELDWIQKPLLLDEVQSGATITNVTHNLARALMSSDPKEEIQPLSDRLYVIAVQDSRNGWLTQHKAKGYKSIVENRKPDISSTIVEMPLFTVDRQVFLDTLLGPANITPERLVAPMVMPNLKAEKLIKGLVEAVNRPSTFERVVEDILEPDEFSGRVHIERVDDRSVEAWFREIAKIAEYSMGSNLPPR